MNNMSDWIVDEQNVTVKYTSTNVLDTSLEMIQQKPIETNPLFAYT